MKALSVLSLVRGLVCGCAVLVAVGFALALSVGGSYAAAPTDPPPGKGSASAPLASPTAVCGYAWHTVSNPNSAGGLSLLNSVSAPSPVDVWAVGSHTAGEPGEPLAMHWDGTAWSLSSVPVEGRLSGVDALAANDVWAVGANYETQRPIAVHWNGASWTEVPVPPVDSRAYLFGVDALSATDVWAVGLSAISAYTDHVLTMHWDGTEWSVVPTTVNGMLMAVYAVAPNDVWAVGSKYTSIMSPYYGLIMHWDGSAWTEVAIGMEGTYSVLTDISGLSSEQIWAVGEYYVGDRHTVVLRWDGTSWAVAYHAVPGDFLDGLETIAPDDIWAVGVGVRLHWDGTSWSREALDQSVHLRDIAATGSGNIWAVGDIDVLPGDYAALTQHYSITCASPSPTPIPPRCPTERFTDVCPSDYFYQPVLALSDQEIIVGYSTAPPCDGPAHIPCFRPYNGSTRGQIAKVVSLAAAFSEPVPATQQTFEDVLYGSTFWEYIERMAARDIIQGYQCGGEGEPCGPTNRPYFRPNNPVTRGQLSKMTSEAFAFSEPVSGQSFEDVPPGSTFYEWVQRIASRGIIQGYQCGGPGEPCSPEERPYFRPNNHVTRGQTAKIVHLAMLEPTPTPTATVAPTNTPAPATTPSPTPSDPECQGIPPSEHMEIVPGNCAPAGTHFDFTGTGFTPGEEVSSYVTLPDGSTFGAPYLLTADENGRAGPAGFNTSPDNPTGVWTFNMVGETSGHHPRGYFKLTAP